MDGWGGGEKTQPARDAGREGGYERQATRREREGGRRKETLGDTIQTVERAQRMWESLR